MIVRNETYNKQGTVTSAQIIDTVALTLTPETGGVAGTARPLTQAEIDLYVTAPQQSANQTAIQTNLQQDMVAMQAIIDTANATLNASPAAALKDIARNLKRLDRTVLKDYTGTT